MRDRRLHSWLPLWIFAVQLVPSSWSASQSCCWRPAGAGCSAAIMERGARKLRQARSGGDRDHRLLWENLGQAHPRACAGDRRADPDHPGQRQHRDGHLPEWSASACSRTTAISSSRWGPTDRLDPPAVRPDAAESSDHHGDRQGALRALQAWTRSRGPSSSWPRRRDNGGTVIIGRADAGIRPAARVPGRHRDMVIRLATATRRLAIAIAPEGGRHRRAR